MTESSTFLMLHVSKWASGILQIVFLLDGILNFQSYQKEKPRNASQLSGKMIMWVKNVITQSCLLRATTIFKRNLSFKLVLMNAFEPSKQQTNYQPKCLDLCAMHLQRAQCNVAANVECIPRRL